jgi:hypothetical protein
MVAWKAIPSSPNSNYRHPNRPVPGQPGTLGEQLALATVGHPSRRFANAVDQRIRELRRLVAIGHGKQLFEQAVETAALAKLFAGGAR